MPSAQIVNDLGGEVVGVTRSEHKAEAMRERGIAEVLVSSGDVAGRILDRWPEGAGSVIDTIASAATLRDDLAMRSQGGMVCLSGSLAESYGTGEVGEFVEHVFERPDVTFYASDTLAADRDAATLQRIVDRVGVGRYRTGIAEVVPFEQVVDAHRRMEANEFCGKVVVVG